MIGRLDDGGIWNGVSSKGVPSPPLPLELGDPLVLVATSWSLLESSEEVFELGLESRINTLSSSSVWTAVGGLLCRDWMADSFYPKKLKSGWGSLEFF